MAWKRLKNALAYEVQFDIQADKELRSYTKADQIAIIKKIRAELVNNPFPRGATIKKLQGFETSIYRLRVNATQSYRVFYQIIQDKSESLKSI